MTVDMVPVFVVLVVVRYTRVSACIISDCYFGVEGRVPCFSSVVLRGARDEQKKKKWRVWPLLSTLTSPTSRVT